MIKNELTKYYMIPIILFVVLSVLSLITWNASSIHPMKWFSLIGMALSFVIQFGEKTAKSVGWFCFGGCLVLWFV